MGGWVEEMWKFCRWLIKITPQGVGTERLADRDGAAGWEMRRWAEMAADGDRAVDSSG